MSDAERAALGAAQERLLAALVGGAEPPPGFDPERIRIQAQALLAKHARVHAETPAPAPRRARLLAFRAGRAARKLRPAEPSAADGDAR
ncbi:conserved hypothetical protein [Actinacidiphila bryophytorum]|uniref:SCO6045-like C-terminal domain-containing protein n=1 Tax=Actinacidiphila bryophytorum TaxID=1436133 RepID=A0A9W4H3T6_9ACTN|nr:conserved hypothetical protein [Actinacidiphila bryophytorum]